MKAADIRNLSVEDLKAKIAEEEANYDQLKLTNAVSPVANPIGIRQLRKTIARLISVLNEKQS